LMVRKMVSRWWGPVVRRQYHQLPSYR